MAGFPRLTTSTTGTLSGHLSSELQDRKIRRVVSPELLSLGHGLYVVAPFHRVPNVVR